MKQRLHLVEDEPQRLTKSFRIGGLTVPGPAFVPEVKGPEDLYVILKHSLAIPDGNPILAPAHKWPSFVANKKFVAGDPLAGLAPMGQFIKTHPVILYDPPELFRYTYGRALVSYALQSDRAVGRRFGTLMKKGDVEAALKMLPLFYRPFVERQIFRVRKDYDAPPGSETRSSDVERAWLASTVDESYFEYIFECCSNAVKIPHATIIPPVPSMKKSTERVYLQRILSANQTTAMVCDLLATEKGAWPIAPYFHLYLDADVLEAGPGNSAVTARTILESGLAGTASYGGVAITLSGYDKAVSPQLRENLARLVNDAVNIAHAHHLPVILPRANTAGLFLTDLGVQAWGSLFNGKEKYTPGGSLKDEDDQYGKVYVIERCCELTRPEVRRFLERYNEFPNVEHLPSRPSPEQLKSPREYRMNFAKPRRLSGIEEAKRLREAQAKGQLAAARLYLQRSDLDHFNHL